MPMLRLAGVLAPERDAGAVAVRPVPSGSPQRLDGLHGAAAEGRGAMTPRVVVTDNQARSLVVTVYADGARLDVPVSPLRALALAGQLIEAAGGRFRAAQSPSAMSETADTKTIAPLCPTRSPESDTGTPAESRLRPCQDPPRDSRAASAPAMGEPQAPRNGRSITMTYPC